MKCTQVQKAFFPFLSGNLDYKTQHEFLGHLNHCPKCHKKFQQLQVNHQILESLACEEDIPKAPIEFWQRLEHRLEQPTPKLSIFAKFRKNEKPSFFKKLGFCVSFRRVAVLSGLFLCLSFGLIGYRVFHNQDSNYFEHGHVQREIYLLENLMTYSKFDGVNIDISPSEPNSSNPTVERYLLDETEVDAIQDISAEGLPLIEEIFYISEPSDKRIL
ncbi:MAG: anti-sigma factor family protein [Candidatus Poribacteria bacterium]